MNVLPEPASTAIGSASGLHVVSRRTARESTTRNVRTQDVGAAATGAGLDPDPVVAHRQARQLDLRRAEGTSLDGHGSHGQRVGADRERDAVGFTERAAEPAHADDRPVGDEVLALEGRLGEERETDSEAARRPVRPAATRPRRSPPPATRSGRPTAGPAASPARPGPWSPAWRPASRGSPTASSPPPPVVSQHSIWSSSAARCDRTVARTPSPTMAYSVGQWVGVVGGVDGVQLLVDGLHVDGGRDGRAVRARGCGSRRSRCLRARIGSLSGVTFTDSARSSRSAAASSRSRRSRSRRR